MAHDFTLVQKIYNSCALLRYLQVFNVILIFVGIFSKFILTSITF